jgi:hypothetical protein
MVRIQTTLGARVKAMFKVAIFGCVAIALSSCATMVEDQKRALLDRKCQDRVIKMLNAVSPVVAESDAPKKFCTCFAGKVDIAKLETDIDGVKDIGLNPETLRFVTEYIPNIRTCAKDTGLWKGL